MCAAASANYRERSSSDRVVIDAVGQQICRSRSALSPERDPGARGKTLAAKTGVFALSADEEF